MIEGNPASARMRTAKRRKHVSAKHDQIRFSTPEQSEKFAVRGNKFEALFTSHTKTAQEPIKAVGTTGGR